MTYETIPVSPRVKKSILMLCNAYDMGKRGQGALVGKMVKAELQKAKEAGLITDAQVAEIEATDDTDQS